MLIMLGLLAAVGYGASDFAVGVVSRRIRPAMTLLYSQPVGAVLVVVLLPLFPGSLDARAAMLAACAAIAGLVGFGLMYHLMATAPLSSVSPITAVLAAATPMGFGVLTGEHPRLLSWVGIAFGLIAVTLISSTTSGAAHTRLRAHALLLAFAAGAGFGLYFVLLAHAGAGPTGLWPLMIARSTSAIVIAAVAARPAVTATVDRGSALTAASAGVLDAAADVCFLLATRHGYLSLVVSSPPCTPSLRWCWLFAWSVNAPDGYRAPGRHCPPSHSRSSLPNPISGNRAAPATGRTDGRDISH